MNTKNIKLYAPFLPERNGSKKTWKRYDLFGRELPALPLPQAREHYQDLLIATLGSGMELRPVK